MEFYSDELFAKSLVADNTYDKLQFLPNEKRDKLANFFTSLKLSPEQEKEYVNHSTLAMYYSKRLQQPYDYVFDNIDSFNKEYFGEELNINAAYDRLNQQLNKDYFEKQKQQQELEKMQRKQNLANITTATIGGIQRLTNPAMLVKDGINAVKNGIEDTESAKQNAKEYAHAVGGGSMAAAKTVTNVSNNLFWLLREGLATNELASGNTALRYELPGVPIEKSAAEISEGIQKINELKETRKEILKDIDQYYSPEIEDFRRKAGMKDNWVMNSENFAEWGDQFLKAMVFEAPRMAAQYGLAALTGGASVAILGATYTLDKEADLLVNNPDITATQRWLNAFGTGIINSLDSVVDLKIIKSVAGKDLKASIFKSIMFYAKNMGMEGSTEGLQQLAENAVDLYSGVHGDYNNLSHKQKLSLLWQGVPESVVIGLGYGGIKSIGERKTLAKYDEEALSAKNTLKAEADKIRTKDNPTDEEIQYLDRLDTLIETSDPMDLIHAKQEIELINIAQEQQEVADRDNFIEQYGEEAWMKLKAQEAINEQLVLKTSATPNYQRMKILTNDIQRLYPSINIELAQNYESLSDDEKSYVDEKSYEKGVKGYYNPKTDKVVIFADNIKNQSELEKTFAHETAGHKGLETLLGNDYNNVLNQIYEEVKTNHAAELQKLAETYGKNLENSADQKYIMEEFLANQADLEQAGFFKSLVQKIKMALRKCGFNAKWTDNEIKTLLRRSLAKQQRERKAVMSGKSVNSGNMRFKVAGKYFKNWQEVLNQFKKDLEGINLNEEQQDIYDVVTQQKDKIRLRINDLNELEDIFVNFGTRKKGVKKLISVHYAGLRNPVTALEVLNIGDVIRRGKITEEGTKEHPTSRRYELKAEDGATLKVIIDFNKPNDKNKSVINFYSDRPSDTGAHNVSSGIITDLTNNLSQFSENANENQENLRFSVAPQTDTPQFKNWFKDSKVIDENGEPLVVYHGTLAKDLTIFSKDFIGSRYSYDDRGFFFIDKKSIAESYATSDFDSTRKGQVIEAYVSLQKPLIVDKKWCLKNGLGDVFRDNDVIDFWDAYQSYVWDMVDESKADGVIIKDGTSTMVVALEPNQIKSATDNIGTFDLNNPDIRYLKDYDPNEPFVPDSDKERMITVLMGVGKEKLNSMSGEEAKVYLEERLFDTDENTAQSALNTARTRYKEIIKSYQQNKKTNWINENYPFYRHLKELGGENAKIYLPKSEIYKNYKGQFFTRKKGEGIDLDVLVNKIAEIGFDGKDLKEKVLKFFNGLTPAKLTRAYRESLIDTESKTLQEHENYLLDKLKSKKTFSKREEKEIKTLKEKYIALGLDLNIEGIAVIEDKPQIQDVSEQKLSKKKNTKTLTADEKLELQKQYRSELKQIQQKYATLFNKQLAIETEKLQEDYRNSIKELKKATYDDKRDIKNVQKIAARFAHKYLPHELHKKFTIAILNLSYKSNTYGKGELLTRRRKALNQLLDSIAQEAQEFERKKNLEILQKKLDSIHSRVNQSRKKVTTRNFETQETLDHIVEISRMSDSLIAEQLEDLKNEHEFFLASGQDTAEIEYQLKLYKTFGSLQNKNATDLQYAIGLLSEIERNGRNAFKELLGTRRAADSVKINYLIDAITRGKGLLSGQSELQNEIKQLEAKFKRPKEELLKLFKMEDFIYILSAANKGKDWIETPLGKIYQRVHNSQVNKDTMLRTFSEKYNAAIDKALGSTNAVNRAAAVQKLRKRIEKTGIYVYGFNTAKDISYIKMDIETARNKLADFDSGKKNMPFYQAEFLRDRLESLDVRMQKTYKREKTDGITEHILTELDKIEKQDNFKSIAIPVINLKSKEKTEWTNVNQMELLTLYLLSRQRDARYKLFFTGFDDQAIKQAEKLMLPELKQLADDMTKYLSYLGDELDKVTMNLYGTKLDRVPFYFPLTTRRVETDGKKLKEEKAISENAPQALSLGSLKKRNAHIMQIEIGDAFDTFHRHALKTIHYISWAETARELRAVFMNKDAVKAMNQVFGKEFYQEFQKSIVDTVNGGNIDLSDNKTLKFLVSNATSIKMMFNYLSGLKQIPSFIAYSNDVPLKAVMKGMSYALRHPKQVFDVLNQTPYFKNRLESGPDIMARLILDRANRISGKKDAIVGIWNEWGSIFTRYGDATALILGGYGVYKYHYDRMIEQGFSHEEANRHALTRFEMSTESLMQSGAVHMQNAWQRNGIGGKLLTAWKSSQILNSQRALREMFAQAYFGNDNNDPFAKDIKSYTKYLDERIKSGKMEQITPEAKKRLYKFYKDFPLGKVIKNKWGESLIFAPQDYQNLNDYIQHFAVKRDYNKNIENFSQRYLEFFPQIEKSLQDPDERILTMVNDTPRISYLKKIQTKNGNHLIITSITPDGRIIFWTHMDSKDNYIEKQQLAEKEAVEKYGLIDGNSNRIYMSYDKYLNAKKNLPLYLATAEAHLVGYPQAELLDRDINLAQKNDLSSKIGKNSYTGAEISNKRHKIWLAQIINSMVVSTFVKFIGDFAGGYGAFGDDDDDDNLLEHIADYLMSMLGEQLSVFPIVGDIAQIGIGAISDGGGISSTDKYMFFDEAKKGFWATKKLIDSEAEAEEIFDIASQMLRTAGLMNRTSALLGSTIYQAKRLYDRVFGDDEK